MHVVAKIKIERMDYWVAADLVITKSEFDDAFIQ